MTMRPSQFDNEVMKTFIDMDKSQVDATSLFHPNLVKNWGKGSGTTRADLIDSLIRGRRRRKRLKARTENFQEKE
ncbi:hypothetical protein FRX31_028630 [Thalictrum thalictroides]|uniref:Uncharacterized protein n=1 Tax=Thalictrum thalictroides TaxID=46969 RepID=A0A7J6VC70_THATH|nr:hypothetical protein FRX31_028630 [Thalictrum thalictroides]